LNKHIIIIGGQRCGTSYLLKLFKLFKNFNITKQIFPEPKYFLNKKLNYEDYREKFFHKNCESKSIYVEKSTSYYEYPNAIKNIDLTINKYLVILLLRDPIKRAISNFCFSKENNLEKLEINEAFERELNPNTKKRKYHESTDPLSYLKRSKYLEIIKNIEKVITLERVVLLTSEELFLNPKKIFELLSKKNYFHIKNQRENNLLNNLPREKINFSVNNNFSISLKNEILEKLRKHFYEEYYLISNLYEIDTSLWN
tara:strand:+ start:50725 stop:51492 length:768 start_codon:yes stop_codon:yes gene_type:complete